jgi:hypothetical protein
MEEERLRDAPIKKIELVAEGRAGEMKRGRSRRRVKRREGSDRMGSNRGEWEVVAMNTLLEGKQTERRGEEEQGR